MSKVIKTALVVGALYVSHRVAFKAGLVLTARALVRNEIKNPGTFDKLVKEYEEFQSKPDA